MNKKDIENSLRRYTRNGQSDWITIPEISRAMGKTRTATIHLLSGLQYFDATDRGTGTKRYFIPDVAERIYYRLQSR